MGSETSIQVVRGQEHITTFLKTPDSISHRQYCARCGGHLMIHHPSFGQFDVLAATLPTLRFEPSVHVNYAESLLRMTDGLPKFKDFPKELGGSGEMVPE